MRCSLKKNKRKEKIRTESASRAILLFFNSTVFEHTLYFAIEEEIMTAGVRALIHDTFFAPHKEQNPITTDHLLPQQGCLIHHIGEVLVRGVKGERGKEGGTWGQVNLPICLQIRNLVENPEFT